MTDVERVRGEQAAPNRERFSRAWFVVLAVVVTASLIGQVVLLIRSGSDVNAAASEQGVGLGVRFGRLVSYFTIESNLLVLAAAVSLVLGPGRDGRGWRVLHLDTLLGIVITGLVFGIVLAGQVHHTGFGRWEARIRDGLRAMHARGDLPASADPDDLALATLAALQGGLLLAQVQRDPRPLEVALDAMIDRIQALAETA